MEASLPDDPTAQEYDEARSPLTHVWQDRVGHFDRPEDIRLEMLLHDLDAGGHYEVMNCLARELTYPPSSNKAFTP